MRCIVIVCVELNFFLSAILLQFSSLLRFMNSVGVRDGVSGTLDQSVDGLPLSVHISKIQEIVEIVSQR